MAQIGRRLLKYSYDIIIALITLAFTTHINDHFNAVYVLLLCLCSGRKPGRWFEVKNVIS